MNHRNQRAITTATAISTFFPMLMASLFAGDDGEGGNRTRDTTIFSRVLYQLSYLAAVGKAR